MTVLPPSLSFHESDENFETFRPFSSLEALFSHQAGQATCAV